LDINKIFGAFDSSSRDENGFLHSPFLIYKTDVEENHPRYHIKMFIKLILEYTDYNKQLINVLGSSDPELDIDEISNVGKVMLYERAYQYLIKLDVEDEYHIKILKEECDGKLKKALVKSLKFYENGEEYEKCAILKQYLDSPNLPA
jgi:hypothetical protein|tara:strand:+ start:197 stop:637 length:441 start_codon:yes stop_codon:yes gene_type:complete